MSTWTLYQIMVGQIFTYLFLHHLTINTVHRIKASKQAINLGGFLTIIVLRDAYLLQYYRSCTTVALIRGVGLFTKQSTSMLVSYGRRTCTWILLRYVAVDYYYPLADCSYAGHRKTRQRIKITKKEEIDDWHFQLHCGRREIWK